MIGSESIASKASSRLLRSPIDPEIALRRIASMALAVLLSVPLVGPAAAADPTSTASPTTEPSSTTEPTATAPPTEEPTPTVTPTGEPTPTAEPTPTEEPTPTTTPTDELSPTTAPTDPTEPLVSATPDRPAAPASNEPATDADGRPIATGRYIVMLSEGADTATVLNRHARHDGTRADRRFERAFHGFTARLDTQQRRALLADPRVLAVVPDEVIGITAQTIPTGVSRVGTTKSAVAAINGVDTRVDADVAIVDTGVGPHPDLNVVGGVNCSSSDKTAWADGQGHGTHVAGTVAALDNSFGVVGVAPGARIWSVRILNNDGYGLLSWYVCGLDWILAQRDPLDGSRPLFESVNMSVAKTGKDDAACGTVNSDILHQAICRLYKGGITVVAAAANERRSAAGYVPAAYNEVITVSALADSDGKAGGLGGNRCFSWGTYDKDDTFADFSNYGSDIDIIAPGKCIWSTKVGPTYGYSSGTSMAAPAVAGAVALYKASRPLATPAEVRESLRYLGNLGWFTSTDPDPYHEPLLDVSKVAGLGTFSLSADPIGTRVPSAGGSATIPVTINRSSTFFERVRLSLADVPSGWSAALSTASVYGWSGKAAAVSIVVPGTTTPGTYRLRVIGTNWGRTQETTLTVQVAGDLPTARSPLATPATGTSLGRARSGALSMTLRVSWPAATDPSDTIASYQVRRNVNGGAWTSALTTAASTRSINLSGLAINAYHGFSVRARDTDGDWSPWVETPSAYWLGAIGDRSASMVYRGSWTKTTHTPSTNGTFTASKRTGSSVRHTFTGRGVAIVALTNAARGKASIYIDGVYRGIIDTRTSTTKYRRVVFKASWLTSATHTIELRVLGTAGRPTVSFDGLVILR